MYLHKIILKILKEMYNEATHLILLHNKMAYGVNVKSGVQKCWVLNILFHSSMQTTSVLYYTHNGMKENLDQLANVYQILHGFLINSKAIEKWNQISLIR